MAVIGWWLVPITLFHLVPMTFGALSWRTLIPASSRPDVITVVWIRWIRDSVNSLLPVAGIGGDIASVRLAHLQGVPGAQAAATAAVDTTVALAPHSLFALSGRGFLLIRS